MNKNLNNNNNKLISKDEEFSIPLKSVSKFENKSINIESIVKNGESRNFLNNLAKNMLEDLKDFSSQSVDIFNVMNEKITHEYHMFLKHACKYFIIYFVKIADHKKKVDGLSSDHSERLRKMEILKMLKERFYQNEKN